MGKIFKVIPDSEAEEYLMKLFKYCKDGPICRLGALFGRYFNEYEISTEDLNRIKEAIGK